MTNYINQGESSQRVMIMEDDDFYIYDEKQNGVYQTCYDDLPFNNLFLLFEDIDIPQKFQEKQCERLKSKLIDEINYGKPEETQILFNINFIEHIIECQILFEKYTCSFPQDDSLLRGVINEPQISNYIQELTDQFTVEEKKKLRYCRTLSQKLFHIYSTLYKNFKIGLNIMPTQSPSKNIVPQTQVDKFSQQSTQIIQRSDFCPDINLKAHPPEHYLGAFSDEIDAQCKSLKRMEREYVKNKKPKLGIRSFDSVTTSVRTIYSTITQRVPELTYQETSQPEQKKKKKNKKKNNDIDKFVALNQNDKGNSVQTTSCNTPMNKTEFKRQDRDEIKEFELRLEAEASRCGEKVQPNIPQDWVKKITFMMKQVMKSL